MLTVFLSVADTLNYSRSSELLHMSLSAVSRTVQRLEEELGQRLFERDNRSTRLTHAGTEFRAYAQRTLTDWQQLKHSFSDDSELQGEISLFCSVTASYRVLAPILEAFRSAHPAVEVKVHTGDQADGINRILSGSNDIAVSGRPAEISSRLGFLPLQDSPLRFCAPAGDCAVGDQLRSGSTASPDFNWSLIPFIVPERGITRDVLEQWFRQQSIKPNIYAQVAGHEAIVAMVGLGLGIGVAPELVVEASGMTEKVVYLPVASELPPLSIGLCSLKQRLASPLVRSLWDVAGKTYQTTPANMGRQFQD
ncbi:MAG: LysR family positive regulator for ilvC [Halioglobus sp.]|jgi:LysR family positive regulator for ilvC